MFLIKYSFILHFLLLFYTLPSSNAIECKVCKKDDPSCLFSQDVATQLCENDNDLCYSWFHRTGSDLEVERDCVSISSAAYSLIKTAIHDRDTGCIKRIRGIDCFTFCSTDLCN